MHSKNFHLFFLFILILTGYLLNSPSRTCAAEWLLHGSVAEGGQIDALADSTGKIHLLSNKYYQLDTDGKKLVEENIGDETQGGMDYPPALAIDSRGRVHTLTRHGNTSGIGLDIRYRQRDENGTWTLDYLVGQPEKWNWAVGIGTTDNGEVYFHTSRAGADVWGDLLIWQEKGGYADKIGELSGIWRADSDARMRGFQNKLFLVSGQIWADGAAWFSFGNSNDTIVDELRNNLRPHREGAGQYVVTADFIGTPDIYLDRQGQTHITYGCQQTVYYNKYDKNQQLVFAKDSLVFSGLNPWHLSLGLSAVAASDDGSIVVAVALRSDGSKTAGNSDLLWSYSNDGGKTWMQPASFNVKTDGGEGRRRPKLVAVGNKFFLFYQNNNVAGISLATIDLTSNDPTLPLSAVQLLLL